MEKFQRFACLIGEENLSVLSTKKVVIVGCGGVGGYVIEALIRSNFLHLTLIDPDTIEESNCNRQIIAMDSTIGMKKTEAFEKRIKDINKNCILKCYPVRLTEDNIISLIPKETDYVIDACDDIKAKESIILYCLSNQIPFISCMGTGKRMDPSKLIITTLDKTKGDPLARILRRKLKEKAKKTVVCTSLELPKKNKNTLVSSSCFVPSCAGLLIASYVVKKILEDENDNNSTNEREETSCSLL